MGVEDEGLFAHYRHNAVSPIRKRESTQTRVRKDTPRCHDNEDPQPLPTWPGGFSGCDQGKWISGRCLSDGGWQHGGSQLPRRAMACASPGFDTLDDFDVLRRAAALAVASGKDRAGSRLATAGTWSTTRLDETITTTANTISISVVLV